MGKDERNGAEGKDERVKVEKKRGDDLEEVEREDGGSKKIEK